ncbi:RNA-binding domain-containing protein [Lentinus tigrinus ALCF2SS1-7]|uniref:RNA-binding domain-containing protein n=1 Tax=Lentinus tigrinus ALCF2SS1-6 TaxID=1328759 RepID=A0A5C2SCX4_9APHY|nr:RNA-binding domain-containing protein [Lentinus tigrinus ALCF2SS1-6]RPD75053.1 RNA-binding domain-containing protein [Lentinus tigrinus ALCF2SS1-7]
MPPKKAQKMSLNEFLGDSTLGSWADEMDALPTAPSGRADDDRMGGGRRRDDFLSSRPDRMASNREDLPLPTEPPFTAFIGNLAFDISETELEEFFGSGQTKSVKIIKDRDEKPKGFGYVEFTDLDALKEAIAKSGSTLAGRGIRVSVAEPQKERSGFGGGGFDDEKFAGNWRREGPLPDAPSSGDGSRRRYEGGPREPPPPSVSDNASDWRSSRAPARTSSQEYPESEGGFRRRGPGPGPGPGPREPAPLGPADTDEVWVRGGKFRPSGPPESTERSGSRFGSLRRGDMGPPPAVAEESDWRRPRTISRNSTSPNSSTPPTPQMGRRKLELLPRSSSTSAAPSPLASPNPSTTHHPRSNPFGAAKPVDVSAREAEALQKIEKEREEVREKVAHSHPPHSHHHGHPMSRNSSRQGSQRETPPASAVQSPTTPQHESNKLPSSNVVRPSISFAHAAAGKKESDEDVHKDDVETITEKIEEVELESSEQ